MLDLEKIINKRLENLTPYNAGMPVEQLAKTYKIDKFLVLSSNESSFGISLKAKSLYPELIKSISSYPVSDSFYLRKAIGEKLEIDMDNIVCGSGSDDIIQLLYIAFLNSSNHALSPSPSFSEYDALAKNVHSYCRWVDTNNDFSFNFDKILKSINDKTAMVMLSNPNNPTGTMFLYDEFETFMEKVPNSLLVVLDEAYIEFTDVDLKYSASLLKKYNNIVILRTFSKAYGLAGLRCGYLIGSKNIVDLINSIRPPFNLNSIAQSMAEASFLDDDFLPYVRKKVNESKSFMEKSLDEKDIEYIKSFTNFMLIKTYNGIEISKKLEKESILVCPLGLGILKDYIRVTIGTYYEMEFFINKLKKILDK